MIRETLISEEVELETAKLLIRDLTANYQRVNELIDPTVQECNRLDVVVNAAGVLNTKLLLEISEQDWDKVFSINVKGLFFVCKAALKHMIKMKGGCFVNFTSISGKVGGVLAGADYSASKMRSSA